MVPDMSGLFPPIEADRHGMLDVGDGQLVYWETCGNPRGKPALVLHGGPGSGCTPWQRRWFDPDAYRVVLFDQRGCGRSTPHASEPGADLAANTTWHLVEDIERLRTALGIDRWLVLGGSWGSELALAYAERYPRRVTELVLWGASPGRRRDLDWLFRGGLSLLFPAQWEALLEALPAADRDGDPAEAMHRLLVDADPEVRQRAALAWCTWESVTPDWPPTPGLDERYQDPAFALAFARLVTHYVRHDLWLEDGALIRDAGALRGIPGVIVNGRFDLQSPLGAAWAIHRAWPSSDLVVVENAGHAASHPGITGELVRATDRFART
jgi:proline iminopeptidase